MQTRSFLGALDHERIVKAIQEAEARSRGEVRVHVSQKDVADVEGTAARQFERLGMTQTRERNGVLLFVALVVVVLAYSLRALRRVPLPDNWMIAAAAGAFVGAVVMAVTQTYLLAVGNLATLPVWMCGFLAAVFGALPLALGTGEGAEMRTPLGISIVGGLIASQLLTLFTTPILCLYMGRLGGLVARIRGGSGAHAAVAVAAE